jgi:hypothetical protein
LHAIDEPDTLTYERQELGAVHVRQRSSASASNVTQAHGRERRLDDVLVRRLPSGLHWKIVEGQHLSWSRRSEAMASNRAAFLATTPQER